MLMLGGMLWAVYLAVRFSGLLILDLGLTWFEFDLGLELVWF